MADYSSLPDHIIEQVLVKIPCIKSIVTCTSVCKSWYALIISPRFINIHLSNPNNNNKEYFLCSYSEKPYHSIQYNDSEILQTYYDLRFPYGNGMMIIGSINGLICYTTESRGVPKSIYMWNPAIRKLKILPKSKFYKSSVAYGFWFDTNAHDYKVAKINYKMRSKVELYSLSTNSWDLIGTSGPDLGLYPAENIIHVNGTLYWLICRGHDWRNVSRMIISFNINNRMFQETLILPETENKDQSSFALVTSEVDSGSLFVLRYKTTSWNSHIWHDVRVYDEGLNKLYMIELEGREIRVGLIIGVRNNNEVLFQHNQASSQILVFNIEDFKLKDFSSSAGTIRRIRPFAESLVLLNDGDCANNHTLS